MNTFSKTIVAIVMLFFCNTYFVMADRGTGKRNKNKVVLNINTAAFSLRNSIQFNLKSGLRYKGSLLMSEETIGNSIVNTSIISYEKGNTTYIIPYKHNIIIPETKEGYAGFKIVIHPGE